MAQYVVAIDDLREREAVVAALSGPGKPAGVGAARVDAGSLVVDVDVSVTPVPFVAMLVAIERARFSRAASAPLQGREAMSLFAARAINEPHLNLERTLEFHVPELDA